MELPDQDQGDFNSGIAIIYRLDEIHKLLHIARSTRDYKLYYDNLISLFMELSRIVKKEGDGDSINDMNAHLKWWDKAQKDYFSIKRKISLNLKVPAELWEGFYIWEIKLTELEQEAGLGMPKKQDGRFALARQRR